jgi:hypothetical protein
LPSLNLGAFGVDFSVPSDHDIYEKDLLKVNRGLLKYGTTSYCPTIVSSSASVYHQVLRPTSWFGIFLDHNVDANQKQPYYIYTGPLAFEAKSRIGRNGRHHPWSPC